MARPLIVALRVFQALLAIANIVLSAYVVNWHVRGQQIATPPSVDFLLFAPIFSLLSLAYIEFAPRLLPPKISPPAALLAVECLNSAFYFAGFIAFAMCLSDLAFCQGPVCTAGRGAAVLAAVQFSAWMGTTIMCATEAVRHGRLTKSSSSPERTRRGSLMQRL